MINYTSRGWSEMWVSPQPSQKGNNTGLEKKFLGTVVQWRIYHLVFTDKILR